MAERRFGDADDGSPVGESLGIARPAAEPARGFTPLRALGREADLLEEAWAGLFVDPDGTGGAESSLLATALRVPTAARAGVGQRLAPLVGKVVAGCVPLLYLDERPDGTWLVLRSVEATALAELSDLPGPALAAVVRATAGALIAFAEAAPGVVVAPVTASHVLVEPSGGVQLRAACLAWRRDATGPAVDEAEQVRALALAALSAAARGATAEASCLHILEGHRAAPRTLVALASDLQRFETGGAQMLARVLRRRLARRRRASAEVGLARATVRLRPENAVQPLLRSRAAREGDVLDGRYRLLRLLGEGGMGRVYEAEHLGLCKRFAVKVLLPVDQGDPEALTRMQSEARLASRVGHPRIIQVSDFGVTAHDEPYLAMELCAGRNLGRVLHDEGRLAPERAVRLVLQVCDAVAAAHDAGVIHRDLKPSNVLVEVTPAGEEVVKVADFGLAVRQPLGTRFRPGRLLGTPAYMPPELDGDGTDREHDGRAVDVYALGVMLYELLSGRLPFDGHTLSRLAEARRRPPPPLRAHGVEVPAELESTLRDALLADPRGRPSGVREFAARIAAAAGLSLSQTSWRSLLAEEAGTPVFGVPVDPLIGAEVGPYRALGAMPGAGRCYRAEHLRLGRSVVLKRLPDEVAGSPAEMLRWIQDCRQIAGIRHPGVARLEEILPGGRWRTVLAVEHVPGESLDERLRRGWRPTVDEALRLLREAARAVGAFHAQGLAHGAVREDHLVRDREEGRLVLVDHGVLARCTGLASVAGDVADLGGMLARLLDRAEARAVRSLDRLLARRAAELATSCQTPENDATSRPADAVALAALIDEALADLAAVGPDSASAVPEQPAPDLPLTAAGTPVARGRRMRRLAWLLLGATIALLAVMALATALVEPRRPSSVGPQASGPPIAPFVHLLVRSEPPGLRVYQLGRALPLGFTPLDTAIPGSSTPATLLFVRGADVLATRSIIPAHDVDLDVSVPP